jgi:carbonic anhydrase
MNRILTMAIGVGLVAAGLLPKSAQGSEEKWSYSGANGPAHWAEVDPAFAACATGHEQSPIALDEKSRHHAGKISLDYRKSNLQLSREHGTIVASVEPGSFLFLAGKRYELKQFHFHQPSEHTLNDAHFAVEMHFVHKAADGSIAVLGVFIAPGDTNAAIAPVLGGLPKEGEEHSVLGKAVDLRTLVGPSNIGEVFHYTGSLTTPPCTEGVSWNVREKPITWSAQQIATLTAAIPADNRPLQPLDGRAVLLEP